MYRQLTLVVFFITLLIGCKQEQELKSEIEQAGYVIISGNITLPKDKKGKLYFSSKNSDQSLFIPLEKTGKFSDSLNLKSTEIWKVSLTIEGIKDKTRGYYQEQNLYLTPKKNIHFLIDEQGKYSYSGDNASINNFLHYKKEKNLNAFGDIDWELWNDGIFDLEKNDFIALIDKTSTAIERKLGSLVNVPEKILAEQKRAIHYNKLDLKISYAINKLLDKKGKLKEIVPPEVKYFNKQFKEVSLDNQEDFQNLPDYNRLVRNIIRVQTFIMEIEQLISHQSAYMKGIGQIKNDYIKDVLSFEFTKSRLLASQNKKELYTYYLKYATNSEQKQQIETLYNKVKNIEIGKPSPKFVNYENHAGGTTSLDDFKGKYVYIDIWATWCTPCIRQFPYIEELEEKYHNKNIEFVSISVDKVQQYDDWRKMVTEKELKGTQLLADNSFKSSFISKYYIKGIPRFIFLDPEGNIINADTPQPSNIEFIEELFSKNGL